MEIAELSRAGPELEDHFGRPQDVEWAYQDGVSISSSPAGDRVIDVFGTEPVPMHPFSYARPSTLSEAFALLERNGDARPCSRADRPRVELRNESRRPEVVIAFKRVAEIQPAITTSGRSLTITAATSMDRRPGQ